MDASKLKFHFLLLSYMDLDLLIQNLGQASYAKFRLFYFINSKNEKFLLRKHDMLKVKGVWSEIWFEGRSLSVL